MNRFSSQKMIAMAIFAIVFSVSQVGFGQDAVKEKVDLEIVIKPVGDQMLYETTEFTVTAGSKVRVIMENTATSEAMLHNVVILKPETDKAKIGIAAIQAGADKGYIPVDPAVLFYTEITKPGNGWWDTVVYWFQNFAEVIVSVLLYVAFYYIIHKTIKYLVLILMSPVMALLSERTEEILTGRTFPFEWGQFVKDIVRGVRIAIRNFFMETSMVLGIVILGMLISWLVPFVAFLVAPASLIATALIGAYYWGFATMDYTNERRRLSVGESVQFIRDNKGIAVGNGLLFYLMISVPVLGTYIGPVFATVMCTVGATLAIHEKVDLHNEDIILHKSPPEVKEPKQLD